MTVQLGHLVQALSRAETADEVARVIAEAGSVAAGAEFANIAVANLSAGSPGTANLYHASSLAEEVAQRYMVIPLDDSTPLGTVLRSGGEVWLRSLPDIGTRYPSLLEATFSATPRACLNQLRQHRAVATRYDKRDFIWRGTVDVASNGSGSPPQSMI